MHFLRRYSGRTAALIAGLALAAACTDRSNPAAPVAGGGTGGATPGRPITVAVVACTGNLPTRTVSCDAPAPEGAADGPSHVIVGSQNVYVKLTSSNANYNLPTQTLTFDVTVRNLIPQALGTTDGVTLDPAGVRVFFHSGPTVTSGTGTVTVVGDGVGTFTAAGQPYYQYGTVLDQYELSAPRTWQMTLPPTVTTFSFLLYVKAAVRYEDGYIDVVGNPSIRSGTNRILTAVVRTPVGTIDPAATVIDWTVPPADALLADYTSEVGPTATVHGYRAGAPVLSVTASRVNYDGATVVVGGSMTMDVLPIRRTWTGATGTDWNTGTNWSPDNVVPVARDTAVVPDTTSAVNFPLLSQNTDIAGLEVDDITPGGVIPHVDLAAFDLTATGSVFTSNSASVTNTSGTLFLQGTGQTVRGTVPFLRVTGTYALDGNLTVRAPLRVDLGRLTSTSFRIQSQSF
jgi:hypothetical protein